MSRYRLSFAIEFDVLDDAAAAHAAYGIAQQTANQLAEFRDLMDGDPEYDVAKLQRLYSHAPPRLVRWYSPAPTARADPAAIVSFDLCEWPDCDRQGLTTSGNFGGKLVCERHFKITNGPAVECLLRGID